jgi:hypothetical protein
MCPKGEGPWTFLARILKNMSNAARTSDTFLNEQLQYVQREKYFGVKTAGVSSQLTLGITQLCYKDSIRYYFFFLDN